MSAYQAVPYILFPALGLVALAIGLLSRRYSAAALVIGLAGLLGLTVSSTWLVTAPLPIAAATSPQPPSPKDNTESEKSSVAVTTVAPPPPRPPPDGGGLAKLQSELDAVRSELEQSRTAHRAEQARREEAERTREAAERAAADAARQARSADEKHASLRTRLDEETGARVSAEHRLALERLKATPPPPPPPSPVQPQLQPVRSQHAPTPAPPDLAAIREKLASGGKPHWTAQKLDRDLISGWNGQWYVVRLLRNGEPLSFADREFALTGAARDLTASAARLREDILLPLSKTSTTWRLFARGTADARPVTGPAGREVAYLPLLPDGTYASEAQARSARIPVRVQNDELPTLRADWLRQIVHPVIGSAGSTDIPILENPPGPDQGRTAELVLYVQWP